jgi:hypothetical protein
MAVLKPGKNSAKDTGNSIASAVLIAEYYWTFEQKKSIFITDGNQPIFSMIPTPISNPQTNRHKGWVKVTHWTITLSFLALTLSGFIILMCHPRLYWGEVGNDLTPALFELPVSRNYKHGGWENTTAFFD